MKIINFTIFLNSSKSIASSLFRSAVFKRFNISFEIFLSCINKNNNNKYNKYINNNNNGNYRLEKILSVSQIFLMVFGFCRIFLDTK